MDIKVHTHTQTNIHFAQLITNAVRSAVFIFIYTMIFVLKEKNTKSLLSFNINPCMNEWFGRLTAYLFIYLLVCLVGLSGSRSLVRPPHPNRFNEPTSQLTTQRTIQINIYTHIAHTDIDRADIIVLCVSMPVCLQTTIDIYIRNSKYIHISKCIELICMYQYTCLSIFTLALTLSVLLCTMCFVIFSRHFAIASAAFIH